MIRQAFNSQHPRFNYLSLRETFYRNSSELLRLF